MRDIVTRLGKFTLLRLVSLVITVIIAVYITVFIANWGGNLDAVRKFNIEHDISVEIFGNPAFQSMPSSELKALIDERVQLEYERQGLDKPFILRSFRYLLDAVTLNLGRSEHLTSDSGSREVRWILLERLPPTLVLLATSQLIMFILAIILALHLSRHYGSILDRIIIALAPTSAAPGWLYGLFLITIFAAALRILPWGQMVDAPPPPTAWGYTMSLLKHMILPVSAMLISNLFANIYSWRTFFLIYSSEDYIDLARAKGLSSRTIERQYILRPTLPPIITQFMISMIYVWLGAIILETVFGWPGIGRLFYQAIQLYDTPVIVGTVVILGYMLAVTVFLLDFAYAALDPRVRLGLEGGGQ